VQEKITPELRLFQKAEEEEFQKEEGEEEEGNKARSTNRSKRFSRTGEKVVQRP